MRQHLGLFFMRPFRVYTPSPFCAEIIVFVRVVGSIGLARDIVVH